MDKNTVIERIKAIGSCENESDRLELLAQLQEDITPDYDELSKQKETITQLTSDNESLRSANMKLFLRIGDKEPPKDKGEEPKEKRKFENLFNEKGEIK